VWAGLEFAKKLTDKDMMVILLPDTGMRYLSKIYNDEWMRENQYFESAVPLRASDVLLAKRGKARALASAKPTDGLLKSVDLMRKKDISQLPVFEKGAPIGTLHEDAVLSLMLKGREIAKMIVREAMGPALPLIEPEARIEAILRLFAPDRPAVLVHTGKGTYDILTKTDVLDAVSKASEHPH
jgi:cystathionine beta-synthase